MSCLLPSPASCACVRYEADTKICRRASRTHLKVNPPKPFDITRKMNVFSSRVQYVELSVENCQFTTRQVPLPPDLVGVGDDELRKRITSRIRAPFDGIGKVDVE